MMMKVNLLVSIFFLSMFTLFAGCTEADSSELSDSKVYEMRTYTTYDGKLDALHQRFQNHTMAFFEKHGMENIGYWIPTDPELQNNTLIYIVSHDSPEAANTSWDSFRSDPEWQEVYEASHADGPIVENIESVYMNSTSYSQMK